MREYIAAKCVKGGKDVKVTKNARGYKALNQAQLYENTHRIAETIKIQISINFLGGVNKIHANCDRAHRSLKAREERSDLFVDTSLQVLE